MLMARFRTFIELLAGAAVAACSSGHFSAGPDREAHVPPVATPVAEPVPRETPAEESKFPAITDVASRPKQCWFAVSGGIAGFAWGGNDPFGYRYDFGKTASGKPVGHGETFDLVGGVYLAPRDKPYALGEGAHEIDLAIKFTFDSIVVPPGMKAEIRDAESRQIFGVLGRSSRSPIRGSRFMGRSISST